CHPRLPRLGCLRLRQCRLQRADHFREGTQPRGDAGELRKPPVRYARRLRAPPTIPDPSFRSLPTRDGAARDEASPPRDPRLPQGGPPPRARLTPNPPLDREA